MSVSIAITELPEPVQRALRDGTSPIAYPIDSEPGDQ